MSIIVVTPTRGRPDRAREAYDSFIATRRDPTTKMVFVVDHDDPDREGYQGVPVASFDHEGGGMGPPMNAAAAEYAKTYDVVGFIGDDHRFRTDGWDVILARVLQQPGLGIAYGDDLARKDIPTQVFIRSDIIRALGWFCLPGAKHLYLDNAWADLGNQAGCLAFVDSVVIEHAHAFFGKAEMDEGYLRVNSPMMYSHDLEAYQRWIETGQAAQDIETVRRVVRG